MNGRRAGFSLIEVLIASVLAVMIVFVAAYTFSQSRRAMSLASSRMEIFQNARSALEFMKQEIESMSSDSPEFTCTPDSYTDDEEGGEHDAWTLSFNGLKSERGEKSETEITYRLEPEGDGSWKKMLVRVTPGEEGDPDNVDEMAIYVTDFKAEYVPSGSGPDAFAEGPPAGTEAPAAVRITIKVTDDLQRTHFTFRRVIAVPAGF